MIQSFCMYSYYISTKPLAYRSVCVCLYVCVFVRVRVCTQTMCVGAEGDNSWSWQLQLLEHQEHINSSLVALMLQSFLETKIGCEGDNRTVSMKICQCRQTVLPKSWLNPSRV